MIQMGDGSVEHHVRDDLADASDTSLVVALARYQQEALGRGPSSARRGYLLGESLPELGADQTYQLWGVINDNVISLGLLGNNPEIELFSAGAPVSALVITIEHAGGVISNGNPDGAYVGSIT